MLGVHHVNPHKSAEDDGVERLCLRHLHLDHRGPALPCCCSTQIEGDLGRSGTPIQHLSILRRPPHAQWFSHVLRLNRTHSSDRSMSDLLHRHRGREIGGEHYARMPVTSVQDGSLRARSWRERWLALWERWCCFHYKGLVHDGFLLCGNTALERRV